MGRLLLSVFRRRLLHSQEEETQALQVDDTAAEEDLGSVETENMEPPRQVEKATTIAEESNSSMGDLSFPLEVEEVNIQDEEESDAAQDGTKDTSADNEIRESPCAAQPVASKRQLVPKKVWMKRENLGWTPGRVKLVEKNRLVITPAVASGDALESDALDEYIVLAMAGKFESFSSELSAKTNESEGSESKRGRRSLSSVFRIPH
jgi:hypothetical protein